jgi:hypothetical protein
MFNAARECGRRSARLPRARKAFLRLIRRESRANDGEIGIMKKLAMLCTAGALALAFAAAQAQAPARIRGTITAFDGKVLSVKTREGDDVRIRLADNFAVAAAKAIGLADIKPGDFVGPASRKMADGTLVAISLQVFPPALRGVVPEGHMAWDLEPGSLMTNAIVAGVMSTADGRELTLEYKGGAQKVVVPEGAPIFTTVPGDRALLVPGAYVFSVARREADGSLSAARVTVSKDGVRPAN